MTDMNDRSAVVLPPPVRDGSVSLEAAIGRRRSIREYASDSLTLGEVSQLLWAAQGVTHPDGYRTVASAGALFPLELYVIVGRVDDLSEGVYRYVPSDHCLTQIAAGDRWGRLWSTVLANRQVKESAAVLGVTASYDRMKSRYAERAARYVHIEVGHVVQNVYLQSTALELAAVVVGSFVDSEVKTIIGCAETEHPMVLMPVGKRRCTI
jgi:SagB-type dehydrogenase family enzyme